MLEEISIQNFALIERAHLQLREGFNVLTGETGAGKTILVGALSMLLGARSDQDLIRTGAQEAILGGVIRIGQHPEAFSWLQEQGFPFDDDSIVVKRILRPGKRGSCYINGTPASRGQLQEFTGLLVDMHGQHEHQSLFSIDHHRRVLDRYLGLSNVLEAFSLEFQKWNKLKKEFQLLSSQEINLEEEKERLTFSLKEMEALKLKKGEEDELRSEKHTLDHGERLFSLLEQSLSILSSDGGGLLGELKHLSHQGQQISEIDTKMISVSERLQSTYWEVEDIASVLKEYRRNLVFSPEQLEVVNTRIAAIQGAFKKYGPTEELFWERMTQTKEKLLLLESGNGNKEEIYKKAQAQEKIVVGLAQELTNLRKNGALTLEKNILLALSELGMKSARFQIFISTRLGDTGKPVCTTFGLDQVEFLFSANPGEPLKPLREIASGGELSRVMLALKSLLAESDTIDILVFDEIDTGIGGEMGLALGRFMHKIGVSKQVLCITHLASLASFAGHHVKIEKRVELDRTFTEVKPLFGKERVGEIARMLSGDASQQASYDHAEQLIERNSPGGS